MLDQMSNVRNAFLEFFSEHEHKVIKSAPLIPENDPTLLFVNSGMAPLKEYFLGQVPPPQLNLTSCQKCIRAGGKHNDLDQVGYTKRHHTFFEMCGNFSFGGYAQEKAISLAWEFITDVLKIDIAKLWVTVHPEDDVSPGVWGKLLAKERIIQLAANEWSMGGDGPCGMCTEIFYDHGDHLEGDFEDGDRFVEIWNLVFMTHQTKDGHKTPLPKICIDTGMGLERITAVLCGTDDNYKISLFNNIIMRMSEMTSTPPNSDMRIIADHARAIVFAISDGILPDVTSRGYVIRKIMRRALVHEHQYNQDLLQLCAEYMITQLADAYPELLQYKNLINTTIAREKELMSAVLNNAWHLVEKLAKNDVLSGESLFFLHDTHGVPVEIAASIAEKMSLSVEMDDYHKIAEANKSKSKVGLPVFDLHTNFVGYDTLKTQATLLAKTTWEDKMVLVFDKTPFYAESGGQESDHGHIFDEKGSQVSVIDVKKTGNTFLHICDGDAANFDLGAQYTLSVNAKRRMGLTKHHSATHLLLSSLRRHLGNHVTQKGSLVREDALRFDFLHDKPVEKNVLRKIQDEVNEFILASYGSKVETLTKDDAIKNGAVATFGEKYGDNVRVVQIGPSFELCGGTHVQNSGEIGSFYILKEKGIAGGIRRIEAVAGEAAYSYANAQINLVARLASGLNVQEAVLEQVVLNKKQAKKSSGFEITELTSGGHKIAFCYGSDESQDMVNKTAAEHGTKNDLVFIANIVDGKTNIIAVSSKIDCADFLNRFLVDFGGKSGGKAPRAQGGVGKVISAEDLVNKIKTLFQ